MGITLIIEETRQPERKCLGSGYFGCFCASCTNPQTQTPGILTAPSSNCTKKPGVNPWGKEENMTKTVKIAPKSRKRPRHQRILRRFIEGFFALLLFIALFGASAEAEILDKAYWCHEIGCLVAFIISAVAIRVCER